MKLYIAICIPVLLVLTGCSSIKEVTCESTSVTEDFKTTVTYQYDLSEKDTIKVTSIYESSAINKDEDTKAIIESITDAIEEQNLDNEYQVLEKDDYSYKLIQKGEANAVLGEVNNASFYYLTQIDLSNNKELASNIISYHENNLFTCINKK